MKAGRNYAALASEPKMLRKREIRKKSQREHKEKMESMARRIQMLHALINEWEQIRQQEVVDGVVDGAGSREIKRLKSKLHIAQARFNAFG
jgi:hypothetical protein